MKGRSGVIGLAFLSASASAFASPAMAIDIHNCTAARFKIQFYNESDALELIAKRRVNLPAGGKVTGIALRGGGTHKMKIYNENDRGRLVATFRAVDGNASYVLSVDPRGLIAMVTGGGC